MCLRNRKEVSVTGVGGEWLEMRLMRWSGMPYKALSVIKGVWTLFQVQSGDMEGF